MNPSKGYLKLIIDDVVRDIISPSDFMEKKGHYLHLLKLRGISLLPATPVEFNSFHQSKPCQAQ